LSEDAITRHILKFVKLLDGGDTDELVRQAAINRNWLDPHGDPTQEGIRLAYSVHLQTQIENREY
jgi:hypothetical protein